MSYFQNPFMQEFIGVFNLGDRQFSLNFKCPPNTGRADDFVQSWAATETFNLSGNDGDGDSKGILNIVFALDRQTFKSWTTCAVDIRTGAASATAVTLAEIVDALNESDIFSSQFEASIKIEKNFQRLMIRQIKDVTKLKFYIQNGQAESILLFNQKAGVAELPTYFARHTIENRYNYEDSNGMLIALNTSLVVDQNIINGAVDYKGNSLGYDYSDVQADYELLAGRSGIFNFQKITVDSSDRITQIIEYPAGAVAGMLARKINYSYTAAKTKPDQITEIPYTLTNSDLITP